MTLFKLGAVVATLSAMKFCEKHKINPFLLLGRHMAGDWGDLDEAQFCLGHSPQQLRQALGRDRLYFQHGRSSSNRVQENGR